MKKNALLVEYDLSSIDSVKEILTGLPLEIQVVADGDSAMQFLKNNPVDLVITAAMLPRFHGFKLCQDIVAQNPLAKVIIISAIYKGLQYRHMALTQYKAADFYEKPIDRETFRERVKELLSIRDDEIQPEIEISVEKPAEVSSPPPEIPPIPPPPGTSESKKSKKGPETTKYPLKWQSQEKERKVTSDDIFGDIIDQVDGESATDIDLTPVPDSKKAEKPAADFPSPNPKEMEKAKSSRDTEPAQASQEKKVAVAESPAQKKEKEKEKEEDIPELPLSDEIEIPAEQVIVPVKDTKVETDAKVKSEKSEAAAPISVTPGGIKKSALKLTPDSFGAHLLNELEQRVKTQKFEIPRELKQKPSGITDNLDELVRNNIPQTPKSEARFKKLEDDIMKKLDQTLSGLGLSNSGKPVEKKEKDREEPVAVREAEKKDASLRSAVEDKKEEPRKKIFTQEKESDDDWDYDILGLIARGGMAEIYKAKKKGHKGFEKIIAIKKILSGYGEDDKYIEMLIDEAKVAAQLSHPNIVHIYDLKKRDNYYFIVMEYVQGKDLRVIQRVLQETNFLIPEEMAIHILIKVLEALNYAHKAQDSEGKNLEIVHRDVSPPNILISYNGDVKLADFGISKASIKIHQTVSGALKGKLLYMSPEQAQGEDNIDYRSDLYSAGLILFELITGKKLFMDRSEMGILKKVQQGVVISPREYLKTIDDKLEAIILKSLTKERTKRYQSANEMIEALQDYIYKKFSYFPNPMHLSWFMTDLFQEEVKKERIKVEQRPLAEKPVPRRMDGSPFKEIAPEESPPSVEIQVPAQEPQEEPEPPVELLSEPLPEPPQEKQESPREIEASPPPPLPSAPPQTAPETESESQAPERKIIEINLDDDLDDDGPPDDLIISFAPTNNQ